MSSHILSFILVLYGEPTFPRSIVNAIINILYNFLVNLFIPSLQSGIFNIIKSTDDKEKITILVEESFKSHSRVFQNFLTEHDRFQLLKTKGFQEPEVQKIDTHFTKKLINNT